MDVISKKAAEAALMKFYYTGKPCKRGHLSKRRTLDSMCMECLHVLAQRPEAKEKARIRSSAWYAENRDRAKVRGEAYRSRNKVGIAKRDAEYRERNKDRITLTQARYRKEKREELARKGREAYAVLGGKRWINCMVVAARKRAVKAGVSFDEVAVRKFLRDPVPACPVFGIQFEIGSGKAMSDAAPTLDRIVPSAGYVRGNLALISWRANRLKSNASADDLRAVADWLDSIIKRLRSAA